MKITTAKNIQTVADFFAYYNIDAFYDAQQKWSRQPIQPFNRKVHQKLSHGSIPGYRNYDLFYERYKSAVEILEAEGAIRAGMKILDIGAGEGFFKFFVDRVAEEDIEWHGVEVWKERAEFCRHIGYAIEEVNLEAGKLPYADETFDLLFASHVIEHIPNPAQIIQEMGRVVKPNDILLVATPTKPPLISHLDSYYHQISKREIGDTQQAFTHKSLEKMTLQALGLSTDAIIDKRGFRIISGRKKLPIENWKWFYELSKALGKNLMYLVPEINLIIRK